MCDVCRQTPCNPRCPNAPEPQAVYTCKICGESIVEGDEYYEMDGEFYHEECFEDAAVKILMDECGAMKGTAEAPEPDYEEDDR